MNKNIQAHIALATTSFIYAATFSVAKEVMPTYLSPATFVLLRVIGALILFWIVGTFIIYEKTDKKDFPRLAVLGMCGIAINQLLSWIEYI